MNKNKEQALLELLEKYSISGSENLSLSVQRKPTGINLYQGWMLLEMPDEENTVPLLTWRVKRKFIELKKIVKESTVEKPRMFRFSCIGDKNGMNLKSLLYREMDLCEFIGDGKIVSLQAVLSNANSGNVILRLDNDIICSVEISTQLPSGSDIIDRHEIIAQRGVASDLVVDTMIPQNSIYSFTENGEQHFRDVDEELFGFAEEEIDHIRSAFEVLKNREILPLWKVQHNRLANFVNSVFESDRGKKKISFNN